MTSIVSVSCPFLLNYMSYSCEVELNFAFNSFSFSSIFLFQHLILFNFATNSSSFLLIKNYFGSDGLSLNQK